MRLKGALGWSLALHAGVLALPLPRGFIAYVPTGKPLSVTFMGSPSVAAAAAAAKQAAVKAQDLVEVKRPSVSPAAAAVEKPRRAPPPAPARLEKPAPKPAAPAPSRKELAGPLKGPAPPEHQAERSRDDGGASIQMLSGSFLSLEHRQKVREHLKGRLTFPAVWIRGFVHMRLTLEPEGRLVTAQVLESSDPKLSEAALREVQQAAPYPAFSRDVSEAALQYDFLIRYEPD
ncbi:MAG: energy transducer TonB [Candidatus Omnitrophica bacterium]|nr:energy transducer TonB [Candidatus Omnitrophota bacterium]